METTSRFEQASIITAVIVWSTLILSLIILDANPILVAVRLIAPVVLFFLFWCRFLSLVYEPTRAKLKSFGLRTFPEFFAATIGSAGMYASKTTGATSLWFALLVSGVVYLALFYKSQN